MRRSSAKRSLMPPLTMSFSSTTPSTSLSATASGVLPRGPPRRPPLHLRPESAAAHDMRGSRPPRPCGCSRGAAVGPAVDAAHARLRREGDEARRGAWTSRARAAELLLGQHDDAAALRRLVGQRGQLRRVGQIRPRPGAGMEGAGLRLPRVMVPVLSSSSTSTSPAASTARPEVAITLACIMRLMPATPMADSRPPIVVGIRQTSSATSTVMLTTAPGRRLHAEHRKGSSVTVTTRKTMVSATSRMVSAISLGVFWRLAPRPCDHAVEEGLAGVDRCAPPASRTARACRRSRPRSRRRIRG
jgi:hypothetical protein